MTRSHLYYSAPGTLARLAEHAISVDGEAHRRAAPHVPGHMPTRLQDRLHLLAMALWCGWDVPEQQTWQGTIAWLDVAVSCPRDEPVEWLFPVVSEHREAAQWLAPAEDWLADCPAAGVPDVLSARACAAGLSPAETVARFHAGTLDRDSLTTLALLRGFQFLPPRVPGGAKTPVTH